jgi:hypothetical protein
MLSFFFLASFHCNQRRLFLCVSVVSPLAFFLVSGECTMGKGGLGKHRYDKATTETRQQQKAKEVMVVVPRVVVNSVLSFSFSFLP